MRKVNPKSYDYIESLLPAEDEKMLRSREGAESLNLAGISISPAEGTLLQFFVQMTPAKKIVEIGTLTGLSAQYILRGMPANGKLWTLEKSPEHAKLAEAAIQDMRCEIVPGDAEQNLEKLSASGPFDVIFIDGNKAAYLKYFDWALENLNSNGIIIADNVFLAGSVWGEQTNQNFSEKQIDVVRKMNLKAFSDERIAATIIPTIEGMLVCRKISK